MGEDDLKSALATLNEKGATVAGGQVVQIIALVKPFRAQAVLAALESVDVLGGTVREAMGYGRQKDRLHQYLGSEYNSSFVPKVELTVFVRAKARAGRDQGDRGPGPNRPDRRRQDPGAPVSTKSTLSW